jgi:hypothetical protein
MGSWELTGEPGRVTVGDVALFERVTEFSPSQRIKH